MPIEVWIRKAKLKDSYYLISKLTMKCTNQKYWYKDRHINQQNRIYTEIPPYNLVSKKKDAKRICCRREFFSTNSAK